MGSPFDVLGVEPEADAEAIERAYRERVLEAHPDHGGSVREFQRVRAAYEEIETGDLPATPEIDPDEAVEADEVDEGEERTDSRVEYLNYEVLDDFGWEIDDEDLFEKASEADLDPADYGRIIAEPGESLLEAAENRGFEWPYACRGGACANCAVAVCDGELSMPVNHILPPEMTEQGYRLSCNGEPVTENMRVVYNVKHLPGLDELRLPPRPFKRAYSD